MRIMIPFFTIVGAACIAGLCIYILLTLFYATLDFVHRLIVKHQVKKRTDLFSKEVGKILDDKHFLSAGYDGIYNTCRTLQQDLQNIHFPLTTCIMCEQTLDEMEAAWKKMLLHMFYLSVDITWQRNNLEEKK